MSRLSELRRFFNTQCLPISSIYSSAVQTFDMDDDKLTKKLRRALSSSNILRSGSDTDSTSSRGASPPSRVSSRHQLLQSSTAPSHSSKPSRRELFLFAVLLICVGQIAWMRQAQSNTLMTWVRDSLDSLDSSDSSSEPGKPPHHHAFLPPLHQLPYSQDACADALQIPKVALLFLTTGHLHHELTWKLWFKSAAGVLPSQVISDSICDSKSTSRTLIEAARLCKRNATNPVDRQHLFSVYVHAPPGFPDYHDESLWYGRLIQHRVKTSWGSHTLVEATRHLLWEAYKDPLNTRFLLISESDIPLYDPLTLWQQLQSESRSRIDTCKHHKTSPWRWDPRMETSRLKFHTWRKSPQWIGMTRDHVSLVLADEEVYRKFEDHCWSAWDGENSRWHRDCFSDEHYFATLLAAEDRDKEGVCESRGISYTEWDNNSAHPKSFAPRVIDADLIKRARSSPESAIGNPTEPCNWQRAQEQAQSLFLPTEVALSGQSVEICSQMMKKKPIFTAKMPETCFLTARKFPRESRQRIRELFLQCRNGVNLLRPDVCEAEGGKRCDSMWSALKGLFKRDSC